MMLTTKTQRAQRRRSPEQESTGLNTVDTLVAAVPDDLEYKLHNGIGHFQGEEAVFSPDERRVACTAGSPSKRFVVVDNLHYGDRFDTVVEDPMFGRMAGPVFKEITDLVFTPDGKHIATAARDEHRWSIVRDEAKTGDSDRVWGLTFSPDGTELAYWSWKRAEGEVFVVKGGWKSATYPDYLWGPVYSPDGRRVAFAAARRATQEFDEVWEPRFSPDGRKVLFGARIGREFWWKAITASD
jgi:hypothetical protein